MSERIRRSRRGRRWRRLRRSARSHPRRVLALGVLSVFLLAGLWVSWRLASVARDLDKVDREAEILRAALVRGDAAGAQRSLDRFRDSAESARSGTSGPTWKLIQEVPGLGDDARGIATISKILADLGANGLEPVIDAAEKVSAESFRPRDHRFPVKGISAMIEPAERSEEAFGRAVSDLDAIDSEGYVGPMRAQFERLREQVTAASSSLGSTYRAARLMPSLLGSGKPHYYLLVFQNNAELRSGGGLPGALSLVRMNNGVVDIVEQTDMAELRDAQSVVDITAEERRVFGDILGTAAVDATLTPDFSRASEIIRARWEGQRDSKLDGIFFVDPVAVSYLLQGMGEVAVPGYPAISANTVVQSVENEIYRVSRDPKAHSDYQQAVAETVFDAFADGEGDTATSIRGLVQGVMEGRVRMHSFRPEDQALIAGTEIAGEFNGKGGREPQVGVYINDGGPTKMQYYLRYEVSAFARSCSEDNRQQISGILQFHNDTPTGVAQLPPSITGEGISGQRVEAGSQLLVIYLTSPVGGEIQGLKIDGQEVTDPVVESFSGHGLARIGIRLPPQGRQEIEFVTASGRQQPGDVELRVTPGAFPSSSNGSSPSACEVR